MADNNIKSNEYERVKQIRDEMVTAILDAIEKNPTLWERGWTSIDIDTPVNGKTGNAYKGLNSLYLYMSQKSKGYRDSRWVTFSQAKELGANVKKDEKSFPILFYQIYDKSTKKEYNPLTVRDMDEEEKQTYLRENVRQILKYATVFNAEQCDNFPERTDKLPEMSEEERSRQNLLIEQVISNSAAPIYYDGGDRAYYSPGLDSIHLPKIGAFHSMQDYYATALHEIAHSTGHESRLNRFGTEKGVDSYAIEELRAELASTFMQRDFGITIDGAHFENHAAYLNSWLNAVRNDKRLFFAAVRDAEKISDYVAEHYLQDEQSAENAVDVESTVQNVRTDALNRIQESREKVRKALETTKDRYFAEYKENTEENNPVFDADAVFSEQVDAVLSGADTTNTHIMVSKTPKILRDVGLPNLPILMTAKHLKSITQNSGTDNMNYHGLGVKAVKKLPEMIADPVMIMDSLTRDDSIVVLTEIADKENRPVIAAIKMNGKGYQEGNRIDANILTSVYGRNNFNDFIKRNVEAGTVIYWSKEKSQELSDVPGIQFPDKIENLSFNTIIRKSKAFVNSFTEKNSENLQDIAEAQTNRVERRITSYAESLKKIDIETGYAVRQDEYYRDKAIKQIAAYERSDAYKQAIREDFPKDFIDEPALRETVESKGRAQANPFQIDKGEHKEELHQAQMPLVINLFAGPGAGKTTAALELTAALKKTGYNVEYVPEYAKELVLENKLELLRDQKHVTDEQYHRLDRLRNSGVEIIVTDSPVFLGKIYGKGKIDEEYDKTISGYYNSFENFNLVVKRGAGYQTEGRLETLEQAKALDGEIIAALRSNQIFYGNYQYNEIDKTLDRINTTFTRLYGEKTAANVTQKPEKSLGEELAKKPSWLKIPLSDEAIGGKFGDNTLVRMPQGEYSNFGLFIPTKYLQQDNANRWILTVGDKFNYRINNDGRQVEVNGKELRTIFSGKELGKVPVRVAPSKRNKAALERIAGNVPEELKALQCWGVYFTTPPKDPNKKKRDKVLLSPTDGHWAKANEPDKWVDFDTAMKYAKDHNHEGLACLLTKDNGITCIDLDECIDEKGNLNPLAAKLTSELKNTYIEKSVSGNGLHIFLKDDVLKDGKYRNSAHTADGELEVYDSSHIISLTGNMMSESKSLGICPTKTAQFLRESLGERVQITKPAYDPNKSRYVAGNDNDVIERIRRSKKGPEFEALFSGKGISGNASEDDARLANMLAFFTDCDASQSLRIMKQSSSYRPMKADSYYEHTINKAISTLVTRPTFGATSGAATGKNKNADSAR